LGEKAYTARAVERRLTGKKTIKMRGKKKKKSKGSGGQVILRVYEAGEGGIMGQKGSQ